MLIAWSKSTSDDLKMSLCIVRENGVMINKSASKMRKWCWLENVFLLRFFLVLKRLFGVNSAFVLFSCCLT